MAFYGKETREEKVFTRRYYTSKSHPPLEYEVKVLYGGSLEKPNISCTCPRFTFGKWCGHCAHVWNEELDAVARMMAVNRDDIYRAHGWNTPNTPNT